MTNFCFACGIACPCIELAAKERLFSTIQYLRSTGSASDVRLKILASIRISTTLRWMPIWRWEQPKAIEPPPRDRSCILQ
jgi:hypothetical protein